MASRVRGTIVPAYLLLCLLLGGSGQGVWANMLLQLFGLALIAWAAVRPDQDTMPREQWQLLWLVLIGLGIIVLQMVPLPAALWATLGGREFIAQGFAVLG